MASKVSITNNALTKVNAQLITSMTENTREAQYANARFDDALDHVLTQAPWNFAIARDTLAQLTATPEYEWSYQYQLPTSPYCLRVLDVYEVDEWVVEGRKILCDTQSSIQIKYIKRVTDMTTTTSIFNEVLALYLAIEFAAILKGDGGLSNTLRQLYEMELRKAKLYDAREKKLEQKNSSWITTRG